MTRKQEILAFVCVVLFIGALFSILPSLRRSVYASPDETAYAKAAQTWHAYGNFFLSNPSISSFSSFHPRSWVLNQNALVPVGFLGWPWFAAQLFDVSGERYLSWLASLFFFFCIISIVSTFASTIRRMASDWWNPRCIHRSYDDFVR